MSAADMAVQLSGECREPAAGLYLCGGGEGVVMCSVDRRRGLAGCRGPGACARPGGRFESELELSIWSVGRYMGRRQPPGRGGDARSAPGMRCNICRDARHGIALLMFAFFFCPLLRIAGCSKRKGLKGGGARRETNRCGEEGRAASRKVNSMSAGDRGPRATKCRERPVPERRDAAGQGVGRSWRGEFYSVRCLAMARGCWADDALRRDSELPPACGSPRLVRACLTCFCQGSTVAASVPLGASVALHRRARSCCACRSCRPRRPCPANKHGSSSPLIARDTHFAQLCFSRLTILT